VPLPTKKNKPAEGGLLYRRVLLYGEAKIGKTTTAAGFTERPLFIDTEGGSEGYEVYREPCPDWPTFRRIGAELAEGKHEFTAIVVDTVDELARHCQEHVISALAGRANDLEKGEYHHPADFEYGKGWGAVKEEFRLRVAKLCTLGLPVLFVSHEREKEVTTRAGKITVFSPDVGTSGIRDWLQGFVDLILRAAIVQTTEGDRRLIIAQPTTDSLVGGRRPPDGIELPPMFSLTGDALVHALSARKPAEVKPKPEKAKQERKAA
jgi:hypothetical protein